MGAGANLVFDPARNHNQRRRHRPVSLAKRCLPHNVVMKEVTALSHEELAFAPGDSFEITFPECR